MRKSFRAVLAAAAGAATLVFAGAALAANTGSVTVWHTPQTLANSQSTTIHVKVPQSTDPIAAVNIYSPGGYTIATRVRVGYFFGSPAFEAGGEFLRATVEDAAFR